MAVRRISDLPNLVSYYPDYVLSNSMIEVSYAKPTDPKRYQSFYQTLDETVSTIVANMPRATTEQFGIVKIKKNGNITVEERDVPDKGLISVPVASSSQAGVVKVGNNISVASDGTISVAGVSTATPTSLGTVKIGDNINVVTSGADAGKISVPRATTAADGFGVVRIGSGITVNNGTISVTSQAATTDVTVNPAYSAGATTTYIGSITVQKGSADPVTSAFYVPSTLNNSANVTAPMYDMGVAITVPGSSYSLTNTNDLRRTSTLRLEMVIDGFITYDGDIGTGVDSGYVLQNKFNAAQYGYWANAGQVLLAKGNRVNSGRASDNVMMIYPLRNGNTDYAVSMCSEGSMENLYNGLNGQLNAGYYIIASYQLVGRLLNSITWEQIVPSHVYTHVGLSKIYVNPGWTLTMKGITQTGQRNYTVTYYSPFDSSSNFSNSMIVSYKPFGATWDNHGPITCSAVNFGSHSDIRRMTVSGTWEQYNISSWIASSDPHWG